MKSSIQVRVIPNAKKNEVKEFGNGIKAYLTAPAQEGKANKALLELLAEHFNVKRSKIKIVKGVKARNKVVQVG